MKFSVKAQSGRRNLLKPFMAYKVLGSNATVSQALSNFRLPALPVNFRLLIIALPGDRTSKFPGSVIAGAVGQIPARHISSCNNYDRNQVLSRWRKRRIPPLLLLGGKAGGRRRNAVRSILKSSRQNARTVKVVGLQSPRNLAYESSIKQRALAV